MNLVMYARGALAAGTALAIVAATLVLLLPGGASPVTQVTLDCGPEGKPTGNGACIDRTPAFAELCAGARRAVAFYRHKTWDRQADFGRRATRSPVARGKSCSWVRYAAGEWKARAAAALTRWNHHFAWWLWLPANWQDLGACETGYGQRPGNFAHANSKYVSAFGISRREYDADAAYFGAPPWNDTNPPTPRQQYAAARGHLARFGDGWTCAGP